MKVALTAWGDRISPVFDSACRLLIAEIENEEIINRRYESFYPGITSHLTKILNLWEIEVLICGAISEIPASIIEANGTKLIPFIAGNIDTVLQSYAKGIKLIPTFLMPGCGRKRRNQRKKHNGYLNRQVEKTELQKNFGTEDSSAGRKSGNNGKGKGHKYRVGRKTDQVKGRNSDFFKESDIF